MSTIYETALKPNEIMLQPTLYKTNNISQNIQQGLNVLKTHNTTTSETWLEVSSNMIPRVSLYKSRTCLKMIQDTQQYPTQNALR